MEQDFWKEPASLRLLSQLEEGFHVQICHFGMGPAFIYSPERPEITRPVEFELAQAFLELGKLEVVKKGWRFDVYKLNGTHRAAA